MLSSFVGLSFNGSSLLPSPETSTIKRLAAAPPPSRSACSGSGKLGMLRATRANGGRHVPHGRQGIFQCGSMYSVSGFDVTQSNLNLKLFDSPISIQFDDETVFKDLTDPVSPIPQERFSLNLHVVCSSMPHLELLSILTRRLKQARATFTSMLVTNDTGNTSAASLLRSYVKVERLIIAELNQLSSQPSLRFTCDP
ncbi:hypothetical protein YC2023_022261 [Brassica napus]